VQNLTIREGMFIKPSMDLLTIAQIDTVWVIAEVFERQSGWVRVGQKVDMTVAAYPDKSWQGLVDYIYPTLDEKTRTLRVRIRFENPQQLLKPNMFSRLTIHSKDGAETLYVKREAIIRNGQFERVVKSLGDGKFMSVPVKTGSENSTDVEIIKGLKAGDQIVTSAQFLIDSESSLTAAFERMLEPQSSMKAANTEDTRVWIDGTVENVMTGHNMLTIEHPPVAAWGWPSMVMDFTVNKDIGLNTIKAKDPIRFLVEKKANGSIQIIDIDNSKKPTDANADQAWVKGKIVKVIDSESKLTLQHEPVEAWGWPSMVMDFPVEKSLSLKSLKKDSEYSFLVQKHSSGSIKIVQMNNAGLK
jgi:Cu(I)/Ag(I) efflux system membrane fusion protein